MSVAFSSDMIETPSVDIHIEGVNLFFDKTHVLKDVSLEIKAGEFFAFLGPSGCGKTTLLRLIAGFNQSQTGRVLIGGKDICRLPPWKRDVGMVFQSYALWPHMTVKQNVAFGLEERKVPRSIIRERVKEALDLVGLSHLGDRRPSQLSGGQQQRIALARTIVIQPKVLLLDEPLSNLDATLRVQMRQELLKLQRTLGLTTIFVTHDQEEANTICDRIAVMNDGIVQQVGAPMALYDNPDNLFVAGFLGTANVLEGHVQDDGFILKPGITFPLSSVKEISDQNRLMFRPQDVAIKHHSDALVAGYVSMPGTIAHLEFLGGSIRYTALVGGQSLYIDTPHHAGNTPKAVGEEVALHLAVDQTRILSA